MQSSLYIIGGLLCLAIGIYIIRLEVKTFMKGEQDEMGFDIRLLFGGIMAIILGVAMIIQNL